MTIQTYHFIINFIIVSPLPSKSYFNFILLYFDYYYYFEFKDFMAHLGFIGNLHYFDPSSSYYNLMVENYYFRAIYNYSVHPMNI